jgi:putative Mg2+ transporter-C (MgtC) family protein
MDFTISYQDMISMLMSILCGGIIGFEREYRSKSAGFRTILLISLGSTIFTIVSGHGSEADDRIAANIITGIGFIGAGVIFKDQISVQGLTTAAVIWTSAAIGMTTGIGYHALAFVFTLITLFILLMLTRVEKIIAALRRQKSVNITFNHADFDQITLLEKNLSTENLVIERLEISKYNNHLTVVWLVTGRKEYLDGLDNTLAQTPDIISFH